MAELSPRQTRHAQRIRDRLAGQGVNIPLARIAEHYSEVQQLERGQLDRERFLALLGCTPPKDPDVVVFGDPVSPSRSLPSVRRGH